jgi:hypothetical protein
MPIVYSPYIKLMHGFIYAMAILGDLFCNISSENVLLNCSAARTGDDCRGIYRQCSSITACPSFLRALPAWRAKNACQFIQNLCKRKLFFCCKQLFFCKIISVLNLERDKYYEYYF